ncbi:dihydropteroate synthase [Sneathiella sp.]|uniref:dihydropteroate synthase n=1 Tax=Sneathiella sp. TaxID=1964365 RepID=UPI0039E5F309
MSDFLKGSALSRGLSSSDRIYLAPGPQMASEQFRLTVRTSDKSVHSFVVSREAIETLASDYPFQKEEINQQLAHIRSAMNAQDVWGLPTPVVMGIVNVTPDSFSDGGEFFEVDHAVQHAKSLLDEGAHILDVGGESTRPGANAVTEEEELARVRPVLKACRNWPVLLSADTRKPRVMEAALKGGAAIINDVTALEFDPDSVNVVARSDAKICLMHSSADPKVMQDNPTYDHVLFDVLDYLKERIKLCRDAGIDLERICVDPGIGFGKTLDHNLTLLKGLPYFHALGCPVLLGVSRKSFIGKIDRPGEAASRIGGSLSALLYGLTAGVQIFRVHDVAESRQAIAVWSGIDKCDQSI